MAEDAHDTIARLPEITRLWASAAVEAGRSVRDASQREKLSMPFFVDELVLRQARCRWRFFLSRQQERIVLIFFRRKRPTELLMDASLEMDFAAVPSETLARPADERHAVYRAVLPPFVLRCSTQEQLDRELRILGDHERFELARTIVFRVGPDGADRVAMMDPQLGPQRVERGGARVRYVKADGTVRTDQGEAGEGNWSVAPFIELMDTVRQWARSDFAAHPDTPMQVTAGGGDHDLAGPMSTMLRHFARGYCHAAGVLGNARRREGEGELLPGYGISSYAGQVTLRLRGDGRLASQDDDEREEERGDTFQLLLAVRVEEHDGAPLLRAAVGPPDFLIGGELYRDMLRALGDHKVSGIPLGDWQRFLASVGDDGTIFRAKRGDFDTNIFVLPGAWPGQEGKATLIIVRARVRIDTLSPGPPVRKMTDVKLIYRGPRTPSANDRGLMDVDVRYFLRLGAALKSWEEALR